MSAQPRGAVEEVMLVATDIVSSSALWEEHGLAFRRVLDLHDRLLLDTLQEHHGYAMRSEGDGIRAMFASAEDAMRFCLEAQRRLSEAVWPNPVTGGVGVRMGVHCASVPLEHDQVGGRLDMRGLDVLRAEHLANIGHGGQILFSEAAARQLRLTAHEGLGLRPMGRWLVPGLDEAMMVFEAIHVSRRAFPPLRATRAPITNLSPRDEPLLGRDPLLKALARRLDLGIPVIALVGPPGAGKSAVAEWLTAAALALVEPGLVREPRDCAWRVPLDGVKTEGGAAIMTATALGLASGALRVQERIETALMAMNAPLLLLDDADGLGPDAWTALESWRAAAPNLSVLITCRAPPPVADAEVFMVPPLPLPRSAEPAAIAASPSGALFLKRAHQERAGFSLNDPATARTVHTILQWTGGLPLAIELTASRLRVLGPAQLAARLQSQGLELASERAHHAEAPRSLGLVMESATAALAGPERKALAWLSVTRGGFSSPSGEALVQAALGPKATPQLLTRLLYRGLLLHTEETDRWTLLPPIAEHARRLLGDTVDQARAAHARAYAAMGQAQRVSALREGQDGYATPTLAADLENLVEATRWAVAAGESSTAFLARRAATEVLLRRGPLLQALELNRAVAAMPGFSPRDQAELALIEGWLLAAHSTPAEGLALMERGLSTPHGDDELRARTLRTAARTLGAVGRVLEGIQAAERAAGLDRAAGRPSATALDLSARAELLVSLGDTAGASADLSAALELLGERAPRLRAIVLGVVAAARHAQGATDPALEALHEAIHLSQRLGEHRLWATLTGQLGALLHAIGRDADARHHLRKATAQRRQVGLRRGTVESLTLLGVVLTDLGAMGEGRAPLEEAVQLASALGDDALEAAACSALATLEARAGEHASSTLWAKRAKALTARQTGAARAPRPSGQASPRAH